MCSLGVTYPPVHQHIPYCSLSQWVFQVSLLMFHICNSSKFCIYSTCYDDSVLRSKQSQSVTVRTSCLCGQTLLWWSQLQSVDKCVIDFFYIDSFSASALIHCLRLSPKYLHRKSHTHVFRIRKFNKLIWLHFRLLKISVVPFNCVYYKAHLNSSVLFN